MDANDSFWLDLFPVQTGGGRVRCQDMLVLRKKGRPFLLLPRHKRAARAVLSLFPAQTPRARAARFLWSVCLAAGLPVPASRRVRVPVDGEDAFTRFLAQQAEPAPQGLPCFGILAGNPAAPGRRFIALSCDRHGKPAAVIKIGINNHARELISREDQFICALAARPEMPEIRGRFECSRLRALSLNYYSGDSPRQDASVALAQILGSWVDRTRQVQIGSMPDWLRLQAAAESSPDFRQVSEVLATRPVHPAVHHGDFAPWNIKVSPEGRWKVLDWERGELTGIPGWDWLHFVLQPKILVEHRGTSELLGDVKELLRSDAFNRYATAAGCAGVERHLALAYMLYTVHVIQPAEGLEEMKALAESYARV